MPSLTTWSTGEKLGVVTHPSKSSPLGNITVELDLILDVRLVKEASPSQEPLFPLLMVV